MKFQHLVFLIVGQSTITPCVAFIWVLYNNAFNFLQLQKDLFFVFLVQYGSLNSNWPLH